MGGKPLIGRREALETLQAFVPDAEALFAQALAQAGLKDRPYFRPDEVAQLGGALMQLAQAQAATLDPA
jgi:hypothetical protein